MCAEKGKTVQGCAEPNLTQPRPTESTLVRLVESRLPRYPREPFARHRGNQTIAARRAGRRNSSFRVAICKLFRDIVALAPSKTPCRCTKDVPRGYRCLLLRSNSRGRRT